MAEPWDYFPFNDRDFTSVAELMLVPGCSPGLFTKQFVEFAPSYGNVANIFGAVIPNAVPPIWLGAADWRGHSGRSRSPRPCRRTTADGDRALAVASGQPGGDDWHVQASTQRVNTIQAVHTRLDAVGRHRRVAAPARSAAHATRT